SVRIDDRFVANAKVGYTFKRLSVAAYARNLFDEEYVSGLSSASEGTIADARNVGIEIRTDF
ncbi:MAG: hypothetical protein AAF986_07045, partial [Pseudomonadota bacterium]